MRHDRRQRAAPLIRGPDGIRSVTPALAPVRSRVLARAAQRIRDPAGTHLETPARGQLHSQDPAHAAARIQVTDGNHSGMAARGQPRREVPGVSVPEIRGTDGNRSAALETLPRCRARDSATPPSAILVSAGRTGSAVGLAADLEDAASAVGSAIAILTISGSGLASDLAGAWAPGTSVGADPRGDATPIGILIAVPTTTPTGLPRRGA